MPDEGLRHWARRLEDLISGLGTGSVTGPEETDPDRVDRVAVFSDETGTALADSLVSVSPSGSITLVSGQTVDGRDVSVDAASRIAHVANVSNPHAVAKSQVGLGSVTNDAQLKRSAADWSGFSAKATPVSADLVLIEDSEASGAKKKVQVSALPAPAAGGLVESKSISLPLALNLFVPTYTDTGVTLTFTCALNDKIIVSWRACFSVGFADEPLMGLSLDGAAEVGVVLHRRTSSTASQMTLAGVYMFSGLSAGSHTIKLRWRQTNGGLASTNCSGTGAETMYMWGKRITASVSAPPPEEPEVGPDDVWVPLSVISVENPMDHGAAGTGLVNDLTALNATESALPTEGGIVYLPSGKVFRKDAAWVITRNHMLIWSPNRQAEIRSITSGVNNRDAIQFNATAGGGLFGVKVTSDASTRSGSALTASNVAFQSTTVIAELVGNELSGAHATGVFYYGAIAPFTEGNYVHDTHADTIHHTNTAPTGTRDGFCWENWCIDGGDDGVACVSSIPASPRVRDMEIWNNHVIGAHARGLTVIGGQSIHIHDNTADGCNAAGLLLASESGYNSSTVTDVVCERNELYDNCQVTTSHTSILVSGGNAGAADLSNLTLDDNTAFSTHDSGAYRTEGHVDTGSITNTNLHQLVGDVPMPRPDAGDVVIKDTAVLKTRDTSFVSSGSRPCLHRIHVRTLDDGTTFQQRFEYIGSGSSVNVDAFCAAMEAAGHYVSDKQNVGETWYCLVLTSVPVVCTLAAVTFADLRAGDLDGTLTWLWDRVNESDY